MVVQVVCPNPECAATYSVSGEHVGRTGRCRRCGQTFPLSGTGSGSAWKAEATGSGGGPGQPVAELPEQFGRYRIVRLLGRGGMGAVYLAHDTHLDRRVALKVPHFGPGDNRVAIERFSREARAAASLDHPNLCPVYDVGQIAGIHFLTMPYIEGKPLSDCLGPGRKLSSRQAAAVVRKLALALAEAHARGVVHRDLKPSNIMVRGRRDLIVMDFGLARRTESDDARLTVSGAILGTPAYMAPEQVLGDVDAMGPSCDIYSLGVILFELLAGRRPFDGPARLVLNQIVYADPPSVSTVDPDVPPALDAICRRAMAREASARFATMSELAEALGDYLRGDQPSGQTGEEDLATLAPDGSSTPALTGGRGRRTRRWLVAAGAAGAAVLLLAVFIVIVRNKGRETVTITADRVGIKVNVAAREASPPEATKTEAEVRSPGPVGDGWALEFDGQDDYVQTSFKYDGGYPITLEAVVEPRAFEGGAMIVGDTRGKSEAGVGLGSVPVLKKWAVGVVGRGTGKLILSEQSLVVGRRVHLAGTFDPNSRRLLLFVDGRPQEEVGTTPAFVPSDDALRVGIGRGAGGELCKFAGRMLWVRVSEGTRYGAMFDPLPLMNCPEPDPRTKLLLDFTRGERGPIADQIKAGPVTLHGPCWVKLDDQGTTPTEPPAVAATEQVEDVPPPAIEEPEPSPPPVQAETAPVVAEKVKPAAAPAPTRRPIDNKFTLTVTTRTGIGRNAGTDGKDRVRPFILINGNPALRGELTGGGGAFRSGGTGVWNLKFDYPLAKVQSISLGVLGTDAWACEAISFRFSKGNRQSKPYTFPGGNFSLQRSDRRAYRVKPFLLRGPIRLTESK